MMVVAGNRQTQQGLQNAMDMRRHREVLAASNQGYALDRVVDGDGEVVARRKLLAGEHHVAERFGLRPARAPLFVPVERTGQSKSASEVEAQREVRCQALLCGNLVAGQPAAGAVVAWSGIALRSASGPRNLGPDLPPCAKARVEHPERVEPDQRAPVIV